MRCPCKGCPHRAINCHGSCEDYKSWRAWKDEVNKAKHRDGEARALSRDHEIKYRKNLKKGWINK